MGAATDLAAAGERARNAAEQLTREGAAVRWVRSVYLPEQGTGHLVFEASTPESGTTWRLEDDYTRPNETPKQRRKERGEE